MNTAFSHGKPLGEQPFKRWCDDKKKIFKLTSNKSSASILGLYPMVDPWQWHWSNFGFYCHSEVIPNKLKHILVNFISVTHCAGIIVYLNSTKCRYEAKSIWVLNWICHVRGFGGIRQQTCRIKGVCDSTVTECTFNTELDIAPNVNTTPLYAAILSMHKVMKTVYPIKCMQPNPRQ